MEQIISLPQNHVQQSKFIELVKTNPMNHANILSSSTEISSRSITISYDELAPSTNLVKSVSGSSNNSKFITVKGSGVRFVKYCSEQVTEEYHEVGAMIKFLILLLILQKNIYQKILLFII